jgi:hypothetical protein
MAARRELQKFCANFPTFSLCKRQIITTPARHEAFDILRDVRFALVVLVDEFHRHKSTIYCSVSASREPQEVYSLGKAGRS